MARSRSRSVVGLAAALLLVLAWPAPAVAHRALEARIAEVTRRIEQTPADASLYVRRAELHRTHRDWPSAMRDLTRAREIEPGLAAIDLALGRTLAGSGRPAEAVAALDRYVTARPEHGAGRVARARALSACGRPLDAAADYTRAIALVPDAKRPPPAYYLDRARALAAAGPEHLGEAIRGLDDGMTRLGPVVTLRLEAIRLEVAAGRHDAALAQIDAALARIDAAAAESPRRASWLVRRAEVLADAGRAGEARVALTEALEALDALPRSRRRTRANTRLEQRIREALDGE